MVSGTAGRPATGLYKAVGATADGFAADFSIAFGWPDAPAKARAAADLARKRIAEAGVTLDDWHVELFGVNALHGPAAWRQGDPDPDPSEVVLRLAWKTPDRDTCADVARHLIPMALSAPPPGFSGASRARPRPSGLLQMHSGLIPRGPVDARRRVVMETL